MNRHNTTKYARTGDVFTTHAPACAILPPPYIRSAHVHQAGFTIVEVMVAVVVFVVGLLAIAGMQTQSISQSTFSEQITMRINAVTHQAENLIRLPVVADTTNNITVNPIFEEANMCEYGGEEACQWSYVYNHYEDRKPHKVRQRVVKGYPLKDLAMIELEVTPTGVNAGKAKQRTVRISYVRSLRFN
jgi:prepilin-type N-terminal cleavage/methylation domain-containing protein